MNLFTYCYRAEKIHVANHSIAIRAAYLIADVAYVAGDLWFYVDVERSFTTTKPLLAARILRKREVDPQKIKEWDETIRVMKRGNAMKHKPPKVISTLKKLEKLVMLNWEEFKAQLIEATKGTGMPELNRITDEEGLGCLVAYGSAESTLENAVPCSKMLMHDSMDENANPQKSYFILTADYSMGLQTNHHQKFDFTNWMEANLSFYNLNILTASELMLVKKQLGEASKPFCEAFDKWNAMLPTFTPEQSYGWYKQFVKPAAARLQQAIDANEILSSIPRLTNNDAKFSVCIGEAATQAIWLYYDVVHSIDPETHKVLQQPEAKAFAAKRKPYFSIQYSQIPNPKSEVPEVEQVVAPVKKSISFD
jgi:hypothetical protein